jgi:flavin reductase (DIM6/NTAB) family NADH-FMN oxidoreductase RutF
MKKPLKESPLLFPLPAVLVSCGRPDGPPNLLTVSWTGVVASEPPRVAISVRPTRHSHAILKETGEFVINVPALDMLKAVDYCGSVSGRNYDKFARTLLTAVPATVVACPMVDEAIVNLECKVERTIELGSHDMFVARVVAVHADEEFLDEKNRVKIGESGAFVYCPADMQYWTLGYAAGYYGFSQGSF